MKDLYYHIAPYIGHAFDRYIIRFGAEFDSWVIGTSASLDYEICMEAIDADEAKKTIEFMVQLRNYKIDSESKTGKYVYIKRIS